jgi:hypothetical protein
MDDVAGNVEQGRAQHPDRRATLESPSHVNLAGEGIEGDPLTCTDGVDSFATWRTPSHARFARRGSPLLRWETT